MAVKNPASPDGHAVVQRLQCRQGLVGPLDSGAAGFHTSSRCCCQAAQRRWPTWVDEERDLVSLAGWETKTVEASKLGGDDTLVDEQRCSRWRKPASTSHEAVVVGLVELSNCELVASKAEVGSQHSIRRDQEEV
jgi:hypothetical protein